VIRPTLAREWALWKSGARRVAGVDEVGMACLAGPVLAAALVSPQQRERLYDEILRRAVAVGVGAASVDEINRLNILRASHLAMARALGRVQPVDHALIDGLEIRDVDLGPHTAIVDGDALSYSIACASIVAKVTRDRLMMKLAERYPGYAWEKNVGYPTRRHVEGIRQQGLTPFHRRGFGTVRLFELQPTTLDELIEHLQGAQVSEAVGAPA
jgi:ribonuclease HII